MPDQPDWLSSHAVAEVELNPRLLADVLREYWKVNHVSQADMAQLLNVDQSYVSKIEKGQRQVRDIGMLLRMARLLDVPPERLGISTEHLQPVATPTTSPLVGTVDPVRSGQDEWRAVRRRLSRSRDELARTAARLYRAEHRLGDAPYIARREWVPRAPIRLEDIALEWTDEAVGVQVTGGGTGGISHASLRAPGRRFSRYSSAIRYLDPPSLFENRPSYRLLDLDLSGPTGRMRFGLASFFDKLDVSEAVAHEFALAPEPEKGEVPPWSALPLRGLIGDPFDLGRRFVMPSIATLTLRRERATGNATFLLHWRDPAKVVSSGGMYGLIPAGEFQPSSIATWDRENDFDLWRNIVREYSEEVLGEPERDGSSGQPLDYENWPLYRRLQAARAEQSVRVFCLGVSLAALTLTPAVLTVAVFDDAVFDELFGNAVEVNAEGVLVTAADSSRVTDGLPFDATTVHRLLRDGQMSPSSACVLDRAWRFRDAILAPHPS